MKFPLHKLYLASCIVPHEFPRMSFYTTNFLTLGIACSFLFFRQWSRDNGSDDASRVVVGNSSAEAANLKIVNSRFTRLYIVVYALAMGADWLQV